MGKQTYTDKYLLEKLKELWDKYGKIQTKLIDKEPNFPTRKCYTRAFGSLENACKLIGYNEYKKHKFTMADAQKVLDERNGYFKLLTFNGMRNKCLVQCKECGTVDEIIPDSLLRNKTDEYFGCKVCNNKDFFSKLKNNDLEYIEYIGSGKCKVKCLNCKNIIEGYETHLVNPKYNCQKCDPRVKIYKIINNPELYAAKTVEIAKFVVHLEEIVLNESLMWFYCLGFLLADGNFDRKTKRIRLRINEKDSDVIDKIANFLHCKSLREGNMAKIDFCGNYVFDQLVNQYNIDNRKTYNPCDISSIKGDKLIAFIVGFIDGDGSIAQRSDTKQYKINIKLHLSWENNLQYLSNYLYQYFNENSIPHTYIVTQPQGVYVAVTWGNKNILKGLAEFIVKNNIPALERKWEGLIERMVV